MNPVWLLMGAIAVVGANALVLSPIAIDVALSFSGRSAPEVLIASAIYGAGTALSALILAPHADRIGLQRALMLALSALTVSLAVSAGSQALWVLVAAQALAGVAAGLALPAIYGLAADIAPSGRESETLGKVLTGWTLSLVLGVSVSALLSDLLHWRLVYAALAVGSLAILGAFATSRLDSRPSGAAAVSPLVALRIPGLPPILASVAAYMIAFYGLYAYLGAHMTVVLGQSTTMAGLAALCYGLGFGAAAPLDRLVDRHGAARAAPVVFVSLLAVYLALAMAAPATRLLLVMCLVWGAANHLGLNILVGRLTALSPSQRGTILGLFSAVTYAAMFLGTAAYRPVFDSQGFPALAMLSALCIGLVLAQALRGRRADEPRRDVGGIPHDHG